MTSTETVLVDGETDVGTQVIPESAEVKNTKVRRKELWKARERARKAHEALVAQKHPDFNYEPLPKWSWRPKAIVARLKADSLNRNMALRELDYAAIERDKLRIFSDKPFFDVKTAKPHWFHIIWLLILHAVGTYAVVRMFQNHAETGTFMSTDVKWWALASGVLTSLGITFGYHRGGTHEGFRSRPIVKFIWLWLGGSAIQGAYKKWRDHHTIHHMFTDIIGRDPHTPLEFKNPVLGFVHSHMYWMTRLLDIPRPPKPFAPSKLEDAQTKYYWVIAASSFLIPWGATGELDGLLYAGFLRVLITFHYTACINSVAHYWGEGLESFQTRRANGEVVKVTAKNVWFWLFLWIFSFGESWHLYHHKLPRAVRHGLRHIQIDMTFYLIWVLDQVNLIYDVNWAEVERAKLLAKETELRAKKEIELAEERAEAVLAEAKRIVEEVGSDYEAAFARKDANKAISKAKAKLAKKKERVSRSVTKAKELVAKAIAKEKARKLRELAADAEFARIQAAKIARQARRLTHAGK